LFEYRDEDILHLIYLSRVILKEIISRTLFMFLLWFASLQYVGGFYLSRKLDNHWDNCYFWSIPL